RDDARESWQRALAFGCQEPVGLETLARLLERFSPQSVAFGVESQDRELELTACGVHGRASERDDLHAVVRRRGDAPLVAIPDHGAHLRRAVAEREVPVTVAVRLEVADFAANPKRYERAFQQLSSGFRERADRDRALRGLAGVSGGRLRRRRRGT